MKRLPLLATTGIVLALASVHAQASETFTDPKIISRVATKAGRLYIVSLQCGLAEKAKTFNRQNHLIQYELGSVNRLEGSPFDASDLFGSKYVAGLSNGVLLIDRGLIHCDQDFVAKLHGKLDRQIHLADTVIGKLERRITEADRRGTP